jgi:hypothetical protein
MARLSFKKLRTETTAPDGPLTEIGRSIRSGLAEAISSLPFGSRVPKKAERDGAETQNEIFHHSWSPILAI